MSRCVVCGALPAEQCNQDTHDARYRMWLQAVGLQHQAGTLAQRILDTIDRARAEKRMVA